MNLPKRLLIVASTLAVGIALLGAFAVTWADPFSSDDSKVSLTYSDPKGNPEPAPTAVTSADEWEVIPPEDRTDTGMIDVTDATIVVPDSHDAADCESGDLDSTKAGSVIREWLDGHRSDLAHQSVWEETTILVTCSYPNDEFSGQVALYVGIPYDGYAYVAPEVCAEQARGLELEDPLPAECIAPADLGAPLEIDTHTILASPDEVLK